MGEGCGGALMAQVLILVYSRVCDQAGRTRFEARAGIAGRGVWPRGLAAGSTETPFLTPAPLPWIMRPHATRRTNEDGGRRRGARGAVARGLPGRRGEGRDGPVRGGARDAPGDGQEGAGSGGRVPGECD